MTATAYISIHNTSARTPTYRKRPYVARLLLGKDGDVLRDFDISRLAQQGKRRWKFTPKVLQFKGRTGDVFEARIAWTDEEGYHNKMVWMEVSETDLVGLPNLASAKWRLGGGEGHLYSPVGIPVQVKASVFTLPDSVRSGHESQRDEEMDEGIDWLAR